MAKETITKKEWKDVLEFASSESGIPKKQLDDDSEVIKRALDKMLEKYQPKKAGDSLEIKTPFLKLISTRVPETVYTDETGNKKIRPECCLVNGAIERNFITAANIGLVDDAAVEKAALSSSKKSA